MRNVSKDSKDRIIQSYLEKYCSNIKDHDDKQNVKRQLEYMLNNLESESINEVFPFFYLKTDEQIKFLYNALYKRRPERQVMANILKNDFDFPTQNFPFQLLLYGNLKIYKNSSLIKKKISCCAEKC